jgi:hypothetical protein
MSIAKHPCRISSFLLATLSVALSAQQPTLPTLDSILQKLEANLKDYDTRVPSFFCDEHVVSRVSPGNPHQDVIADSIFRLRRSVKPDASTTLDESREVKTMNEHAASSHDLSGPSIISGAFEGGLAVVSLTQQECMRYKLERPRRKSAGGPYIIRFETRPNPSNPETCLLEESAKGRAFIDPASMQITHLEFRVPHHVISHGEFGQSKVEAEWVLSVDYAPVTLDGRTFWMPSEIDSRNTSGGGTFHPVVWSYRATYRNYHKLEVTSRIVPEGGNDSQ